MENDFICPYPYRWNEIFKALCAGYEKQTGVKLFIDGVNILEAGGPPIPLILNGWVFSTDYDKKKRWIETVEWAEKHGLSKLISVNEIDKCFFAGHDHSGGLRGGYEDYTERLIKKYSLREYVTLNNYLQNPFKVRSKLPDHKGVYFVIHPYAWPEPDYDFLIEGTGGYFKGKDPNIPVTLPDFDESSDENSITKFILETETLFGNWVEYADILYIGKAGGISKNGKVSNATLKKRIISLLQFGNGKKVAHWGGRYLWQHNESHDFKVYWYVCQNNENPYKIERDLLEEFKSYYGKMPFANLL